MLRIGQKMLRTTAVTRSISGIVVMTMKKYVSLNCYFNFERYFATMKEVEPKLTKVSPNGKWTADEVTEM